MTIAITADWLPTYGGAEHVLAAFAREWPTAPIWTTVASTKKLGPLAHAEIRTDPLLQRIYRWIGRHEYLLPWMPCAVERMRCDGYDVVLSSSHAVGKGIIIPPTTVHVCYCHTPMRYAWEMEDQYLKDFRVRGFLRKIVQKQLKRLRRWDLSTAKRVDHFIANSSETQSRIRRTYGRESVVIPPPVDARFFEASLELPSATVQPYFLALGRLVPYKRFDVLIKLANQHQIHLKIGGTGSDKARLMSLAGPTVEFLDYVPDEDLPALYANAEALLFPQEEDAGIVPMEAQACGTPVIAFRKGGILDVVVAGTTGVFADEQTVESFEKAIDEFRSIAWNRGSIREHAKQFHETSFRRRMREEISTAHSRYVFSSHQG